MREAAQCWTSLAVLSDLQYEGWRSFVSEFRALRGVKVHKMFTSLWSLLCVASSYFWSIRFTFFRYGFLNHALRRLQSVLDLSIDYYLSRSGWQFDKLMGSRRGLQKEKLKWREKISAPLPSANSKKQRHPFQQINVELRKSFIQSQRQRQYKQSNVASTPLLKKEKAALCMDQPPAALQKKKSIIRQLLKDRTYLYTNPSQCVVNTPHMGNW